MNPANLNALHELMIGVDSMLSNKKTTSYPPYNVIKCGNEAYIIEIAVTGFSKDEIEVTVDNDVLTVYSNSTRPRQEHTYLHHGLATREFKRKFNMASSLYVTDAIYGEGMIRIHLDTKKTCAAPIQINIRD